LTLTLKRGADAALWLVSCAHAKSMAETRKAAGVSCLQSKCLSAGTTHDRSACQQLCTTRACTTASTSTPCSTEQHRNQCRLHTASTMFLGYTCRHPHCGGGTGHEPAALGWAARFAVQQAPCTCCRLQLRSWASWPCPHGAPLAGATDANVDQACTAAAQPWGCCSWIVECVTKLLGADPKVLPGVSTALHPA
jgi:hypothetical protein